MFLFPRVLRYSSWFLVVIKGFQKKEISKIFTLKFWTCFRGLKRFSEGSESVLCRFL
jgi:hypothetical protein